MNVKNYRKWNAENPVENIITLDQITISNDFFRKFFSQKILQKKTSFCSIIFKWFTVFCLKLKKKDATIQILFYVTQLISIMTEQTYLNMFQMFHSPLRLDQSNTHLFILERPPYIGNFWPDLKFSLIPDYP